jgi:hypothetical protein
MDAHLPTKDRRDLISEDDIDDSAEDNDDINPMEEVDFK